MKEFLGIKKAHENTLQSESTEAKFAVLLEFSDDSVFCVLQEMPLYNTELCGDDWS